MIAGREGLGSYEVLTLLRSKVADQAEVERSRSLRRRCSATTQVLRREQHLIEQLRSSGIEYQMIPTILASLGNALDVDIAVELLQDPESVFAPVNNLENIQSSLLISKLSLLYVTGHLQFVKPNYEHTLASMPVQEIAELRETFMPWMDHGQIAEVLAMIETTKQAIQKGTITGISYWNYMDMAEIISLRGGSSAPRAFPWPVPVQYVRDRLGSGFWENALATVGLEQAFMSDSFSGYDYREAARTARNRMDRFGSLKDPANYDGWVIAETAALRERPSLIEMQRHFGTWGSVVGAAWDSHFEDEIQAATTHYTAENRVEHGWARAGELIADALLNMPWNSFLSIDYGDDSDGTSRPYAQASPSASGVWCEIVSARFLPADTWPIDADYLLTNGWSEPDEEVPNWHKQGIPPIEAGHQILEGLRYGRVCGDPKKVRWHIGDFPGGPGPNGGIILKFAARGLTPLARKAS